MPATPAASHIRLLSSVLFIFFQFTLCGQRFFQRDSVLQKPLIAALPLFYYLPEAGYGFGLSGTAFFHLLRDDSLSPLSNVQVRFSLSTRGHIVSEFPFYFSWNERKNILSGEMSYNRYRLRFYGASNLVPPEGEENFKARFPRLRVNYLYRISKHIYTGVRWWFEDYKVLESQPGGLLAQEIIPGSEGSTVSGPGIVAMFDSRDNVYSAQEGFYLELVYHNQSRIWGSTHWYDRYRVDARAFFPIFKNQLLALQAFADVIYGSVPFNQMALIGSSKRMRGYYEGRYRDNCLALFQSEYRMRFSRVIGATLFYNTAVLEDNPVKFFTAKARHAGGVGIRLYIPDNSGLGIRLDYAYNVKPGMLYLVVNEAF